MLGDVNVDWCAEHGAEDDEIFGSLVGVDTWDPRTGDLRSTSDSDIACWMIDHDYDGVSFFSKQVYFPVKRGKGKADLRKLAKALGKRDLNPDYERCVRTFDSRPFTPGELVAVKVITVNGVETTSVFDRSDIVASVVVGG